MVEGARLLVSISAREDNLRAETREAEGQDLTLVQGVQRQW